MPRFYFQIHDGIIIEDHEGALHQNSLAAMDDARESARELLASGARIGRDRRHWSISVYDADHVIVGVVHFADTLTPDHRG